MRPSQARSFSLAVAFGLLHSTSTGAQDPSSNLWDRLERDISGRVAKLAPFASPCYEDFNSPECTHVREMYLDPQYRSGRPNAYIQPQWETCQNTETHCLLDSGDPHNISPTLDRTCGLGSVSEYMNLQQIDVQHPNDVRAAFAFSKRTKVPLVIKNTGHDYKGRSSAPGSLVLWTHNLKQTSYASDFRPHGCAAAQTQPAVTLGAGVQWAEAYAFAEQHNITLVGGADPAVGAGGGHGALSNTMGLGVDRVLQYKVMTPDGKLRIANECQNEDLFWALRGGGGGTFGVVLEATIQASPPVKLQSVIISFQPNTTRTREAWTLLAENGLKWSQEGWGGYSNAGAVVLLNPVLSKEDAATSVAPLLEFGRKVQEEGGARLVEVEFPTWGAFFNVFARDFAASSGKNLAIASRLINKSNLQTPAKQQELVDAFLATEAATPGLILLMTAPASFPSTGKTSVTEKWRDSVFHTTLISQWNWNATKEEVREQYRRVSESADNLRRITDDAAYLNEADVYEPNWQESFWGEHYNRLLQIKNKYDPDRLLDCWHCVGWEPSSPRFSCYLDKW
ncbi:FAD binding domain-containing protein [Coprinopsis cinerea okayama7|uniref:FAD binding domain-containing protein n=1 Tax=Coprinopsis cinerea (strain Okayama-7 / 130 / ATCC MYA-4618 / FGSC 9003) TaxID=240176 RepID=A8NQB7_COPC7|nr:FAD binding domain-containing protein [Coprinopsis cinerea okayama7\|eukprot:XP_001835521.2 FAD binding domain-containing protein [Coprinopsis cinerea okayama7\